MRKLLLGSAAVLLTGAIAYGANFQLAPSGFVAEPSQIIAIINTLIQQLNANGTGVVASQTGPTTSIATTVVQTFATTPIPSGTLNQPGQTLRLKCWGSTPANTDTKWVGLTFGSTTVTSGAFTQSAAPWSLDLTITSVTTTANYVAQGQGLVGTTIATNSTFSRQVTSDNLGVANTASCTGQQGTSIAADILMLGFTVEQVK